MVVAVIPVEYIASDSYSSKVLSQTRAHATIFQINQLQVKEVGQDLTPKQSNHSFLFILSLETKNNSFTRSSANSRLEIPFLQSVRGTCKENIPQPQSSSRRHYNPK